MNDPATAQPANDEDPKPRRGKGRPLSPGQAVGREALIKAACELLEQLPPAKVTRAEVARHAGVDPALIRYYFRDRDSLLVAVVQKIVDSSHLDRANAGSGGLETVRSNAKAFFRFMTAHPYFHRLLIEELGQSDSDETRDIFRTINIGSIERHGAVMAAGMAKGEVKAIPPVLLHIARIGLCEYFLAAKPMLEEILGDEVDMDALTAQYEELIGDMMVGGVRR